MKWSMEEAAERYHLRLILATVEFRHPQYHTIGQLREAPATRAVWERYLDVEAEPVPQHVNRLQWRRQAIQARLWLQRVPPDTPVGMACEIQVGRGASGYGHVSVVLFVAVMAWR